MRGLIEAWILAVALAGASFAMLNSIRRGIEDRTQRRSAWLWTVVCTCLLFATVGLALTIFRWCFESAAPSLGLILPSAPAKGLDAMICLSSRANDLIAWILIVVACVTATGLFAMGIRRDKSAARRALALAGSAVLLLFAIVNGGLVLFGISWCQSQRLF